MEIRITYCGIWNYLPKAQVVASELNRNFTDINVELVKGSGGVFDVVLLGDSYNTGDRILFSKTITKRFPHDDEIFHIVAKLLK